MYPNIIDCLKRVRSLVCSNAVPLVTEVDIYILYSGGLTFHRIVPLTHISPDSMNTAGIRACMCFGPELCGGRRG